MEKRLKMQKKGEGRKRCEKGKWRKIRVKKHKRDTDKPIQIYKDYC